MKTMTIEALLTWAFTAELCKVGGGGDGLSGVAASSWSMVDNFAALGTLIDRSPNAYGVIPGFIEDGEPHADALVIGDAVRALAGRGFDIPEGWQPFPEWSDEHGLIAAEVARVVGEVRLKGERLAGRHVVALVTSAAILGRGPDWEVGEPKTRIVEANGKPLWFVTRSSRDAFGRVYAFEGDGYDRKKQRPMRGAYRKFELSSSIRGAILSRLDWELWQDALADMADRLDGRLESHRIAPFYPDRHPWRGMVRRAASA